MMMIMVIMINMIMMKVTIDNNDDFYDHDDCARNYTEDSNGDRALLIIVLMKVMRMTVII